MAYTLKKTFPFEAAHKLPHHDGKCARLHGHSWKLTVVVDGEELERTGPKAGMLVDYGDLSSLVKPLVEDYLDHHYLNETTGLENPTSEELACWIYNKLHPIVPGLVEIIINETCTSECSYCPVVAALSLDEEEA